MSLAKRILNNPGLSVLCVEEEIAEVKAVLDSSKVVKLRRTFNQPWPDGTVVKYWRVIAPVSHPNCGSDLSFAGLKQWGIIR